MLIWKLRQQTLPRCLLALGAASLASSVLITVALAPIGITVVRDQLRFGCVRAVEQGSNWTCPDGVAYAIPLAASVVALACLFFGTSIVFLWRHDLETRWRIGRLLARGVAILLIGQAPLSVAAGLTASYSAWAAVFGLLIGASGLVTIVLSGGGRGALRVSCLVSAVSVAVAILPAILLAPLAAACVGLLLTAVFCLGGRNAGGPKVT